MRQHDCQTCNGARLRPEALAVSLDTSAERCNIDHVSRMSVQQAADFFSRVNLNDTERQIAAQILKEVRDRLSFMASVGLEYLTLDRRAATLSGGEAQRIRLATQIGSALVGVLYILDEPTIGLHQRDNQRLLDTLCHLRDLGNTLIVVEHDEQTLRTADHIVDLGPGAGVHGGQVTAAGTLEQVMATRASVTGRYLAGASTIPVPAARSAGNGHALQVIGAREHNLKRDRRHHSARHLQRHHRGIRVGQVDPAHRGAVPGAGQPGQPVAAAGGRPRPAGGNRARRQG